MEELKKNLEEVKEILEGLVKKSKVAFFFEKVIPVLATIFLGIAGTIVSFNQHKISELQVQLQENAHRVDSIHAATQILIQENQNKVNQDRQYIALIYDDIVSGDKVKVQAALKLVKKMRPEVAKAFLEILEGQNEPETHSRSSDIEEIQVNYSNSLKNEEVTIGIHRLRYSDESIMNDVTNKLTSEEYEIIGNFYHQDRASWMATVSTVFYYGNDESKRRASEISDYLGKAMNIDFNVRKGAGLGVDKTRKNYHHFIHIISD